MIFTKSYFKDIAVRWRYWKQPQTLLLCVRTPNPLFLILKTKEYEHKRNQSKRFTELY